MNVSTSTTLSSLVREECERQRNLWFKKYAIQEPHIPAVIEDGEIQIPYIYMHEFSAVVSGCQDPPSNIEYIGLNGCNTTSWNKELESACMRKLGGPIGGKSSVTGCKNVIGHCAEQHAANSVMNDLYKGGISRDVEQLTFSKAFRPRTMKTIDYCANCETLFT